jgi:hypothetical protein
MEERTVTITSPLLTIDKVFETDAVERNRKSLAVQGGHGFQVEVNPHEIVTVRIVGNPVLRPPME